MSLRFPKSYEQAGCVMLFVGRSSEEVSGLDPSESVKAAAVEVSGLHLPQVTGSGSGLRAQDPMC